MNPTQVILSAAATLLAADTVLLDNAADVEVILIKEPFTPGPDLVIGDLVEADFDGYTPLAKAGTSPVVTTDPATGDKIIRLPDPAGGWNWATTGVTNLPQTIYGFAVMNEAETVILCSETFDTPIVLTAVNQVVDIPRAELVLPKDSFSA